MTDLAEQLVAEEEGRKRTAYPDSRGFLTIGIGCCVDPKVIGTGLCDAAIDAQFAHDRATADSVCARIPGFASLNEVQQAALVSIAFQLDAQILGWAHFMAAMCETPPNVKAAAAALLDSEWARRQTPQRATRECEMLETGVWVPA
jgi:GH24 family phage-related lysozyme (muramidase)